MFVRDSGCIRIMNNTKKWWTFDRGVVVNEGLPGGGFQKTNKQKVSPGLEMRVCAPYGIATQDHAVYNLASFDKDPIPNWSGGKFAILNDLSVVLGSIGAYGKVAVGLGIIAVVGIVAYKAIGRFEHNAEKVVEAVV